MSNSTTPPSPDGVPLLGNGMAFARDPVGAMEAWSNLGDVVKLEVPGQSLYLVTHPTLIEQILVDEHDSFTIGPGQRETFAGVEDHAVTMTTGQRWQRLRAALRPAFAHDAMERYRDRMAATTAASVDTWTDGQRFDLHRQLRLLTVNILADSLLDVDMRGQETVAMDAADALVDRANFRRPGQLLPDWVPTPTDRRFERTVGALDDYIDGLIEDRRGSPTGHDVCSVLLAAHEAGDLSLEAVRHNLVALLLAGHESPAGALTMAWYLLAEHPDVLDSLRDEYDAVVDGERPRGQEYHDLERTSHVILESLRLYPTTAGVNRQALEPVTLGEYELPAGSEFLLPQWVVHRDARFWDDPTTFDPSRWDEPAERPDYAYFPFSGGPRHCVGRHFARQELVLALATMVGRVDLDVSVDGSLTFTPSVQLRPATTFEATVHRR